jgi:rhodanese-related sulfurtransferase
MSSSLVRVHASVLCSGTSTATSARILKGARQSLSRSIARPRTAKKKQWVVARATENDGGDENKNKNPLLQAFEEYKEKEAGSMLKSPLQTLKGGSGKKEDKLDLRDSLGSFLKPESQEEKDAKWQEKDKSNLFGATAPGLSPKTGKPKLSQAEAEWIETRKALTDFGLQSVSSQDASNMVKDGKAVIVDVRTKQAYEIEHVEPSMSLPLYVRAKGGEGSFAKKVFLGSKTTRKNEDFAADAKALLGDEQRTIIVACSTGGDLTTEGSVDSLSLRACNELIGAGYTNVRHLGGGIAAWKAEGLAVAGFMVRQEKSFLNGRPPVEVDTTPVTEEKYKVLGIPQGQKTFKVWPAVFEALTSSGLRSVDAEEASNLVKNKKAAVLDVNNESQFVEGHIKGSVNCPLYIEVEEKRTLWIPLLTLNAVTNILTGSNTRPKVRSETFVEDCKKALGTNGSSDMSQSIVVTCGRGGTLSTGGNGKLDKDGRAVELQKSGIESSSLRACYELMEAGYKNVVHLEGGNSAWNYANLPMEGQLVQKVFIQNKGGVALSLAALSYFIYLVQN